MRFRRIHVGANIIITLLSVFLVIDYSFAASGKNSFVQLYKQHFQPENSLDVDIENDYLEESAQNEFEDPHSFLPKTINHQYSRYFSRKTFLSLRLQPFNQIFLQDFLKSSFQANAP